MPSTFATDGKIVNFKYRTAKPEYKLGTVAIGDQDSAWVYVQADVSVNAAQAPVMSEGFHLTEATGGTFTADAAFAINEFGWVRKTAALV